MKTKTISGKEYFVIDIDARRDRFFSDLHRWLDKHATGRWATMSTLVGFEKEQDAVFFRLVNFK